MYELQRKPTLPDDPRPDFLRRREYISMKYISGFLWLSAIFFIIIILYMCMVDAIEKEQKMYDAIRDDRCVKMGESMSDEMAEYCREKGV